MNIVIVEDDLIVADHLSQMLNKHGVNVIATCDSYQQAIQAITLKPDLFLIDIRLSSRESGIDVGVELQKHQIPFVYVTANNEIHTMKLAVQTKPLTYLSKPYKEVDILAIIEVYNAKQNTPVSVKTSLGKTTISIQQILYIEAKGSYVNIVTGQQTYHERANLNQYQDLHANLIRVHRSYIVNATHITQFNSSHVYIHQLQIPISRSYKQQVLNILSKN